MDIKSVSREIDKLNSPIIITLLTRGKKFQTTVEGLYPNHKELLKAWKTKLSCNGYIVQKVIVFQGDHKAKLYDLIVKEKYDPKRIEY